MNEYLWNLSCNALRDRPLVLSASDVKSTIAAKQERFLDAIIAHFQFLQIHLFRSKCSSKTHSEKNKPCTQVTQSEYYIFKVLILKIWVFFKNTVKPPKENDSL